MLIRFCCCRWAYAVYITQNRLSILCEAAGVTRPGLQSHQGLSQKELLLATLLAHREEEFAQDSVAALGTVAGAAGAAGVSLYVRSPGGLDSASGPVAARVASPDVIRDKGSDMVHYLLRELHRMGSGDGLLRRTTQKKPFNFSRGAEKKEVFLWVFWVFLYVSLFFCPKHRSPSRRRPVPRVRPSHRARPSPRCTPRRTGPFARR